MADRRASARRAWRPAPPSLVAVFDRAVHTLRGVEQRKMFGYPAVFVGGNMFAGLVRNTLILRLGESDRAKFLALPGAKPFVAMGGRRMKEWMVVPSATLRSPSGLRTWVRRALARGRANPAQGASERGQGMTPVRLLVATGVAVVLLAAPSSAEETRARAYALPQHGTLQLTVPVSWKDAIRQPTAQEPLTIAFTPDKGPGFAVFVVPMWPVTSNPPPVTADGLRRLTEQAAVAAKQQAMEQKLEVKELKGASGPGYYFSATDRAPAAGEYKYLTQGTLKVGGIVVEFTILTNDGQTDVVTTALAMLAGATHSAR